MTKPFTLRHGAHGFTLIELLIVLMCATVLTSVAWPSYQQHLLRSHRVNACSALLQAAHWLERSASANGSYPANADIPSSVISVNGQRYALQTSTTTQTYTLSAVPLGTQAQDACGTLTLNHLGERGVQNATQSVASCWGY